MEHMAVLLPGNVQNILFCPSTDSYPRSGLAWKHHIDIGAGVVDEDYRGNIGDFIILLVTTHFTLMVSAWSPISGDECMHTNV